MAATDIADWSAVGIHIGSTAYTLNLSNLTKVTPLISSIDTVVSSGIRGSYQNGLEKINLTDVKFLVRYENADYTKEVGFSNTNTATASTFSVVIKDTDTDTQILNDVDYINGNDTLDLADTSAIYHCAFYFWFYNEFTTLSVNKKTTNFSIVTVQKLTGIKIIDPYTDYKVGETFLNDNDTTKAKLFFDVDGGGGNVYTDSITVDLKDDIPTVSINYAKGTEWTTVDSSKRIIVSSIFDSNISAEYVINVEYDGYVSGSKTNDFVVVWQPSITLPDNSTYTEDNGILAIYKETDTEVNSGIRSVIDNTRKPVGYFKNIFDTRLIDAQATMVLFDDYDPPIEGSANITVLYPSYSGLADDINKCQFGILFGNNNANNRLFVSGNPNTPNADWHSGETNTVHSDGEVQKVNGDFSYFPNENIMYYGETDNKVIGYDIVSNNKLLVLKDKSDKEKTVYFRTPTLVTALDAGGNEMKDVQGNTLYQEAFALVKGNNSVAGISPHSIINLNGDTLFVDSDNTVEGLDLTGIIGDNQRYANSRSKLIDQYLKDLDLSESFLWTNNKYLFFPIKDKGLFITHIDTLSSENGQYEWWLIQSENPTTFIEVEGKVYFGNAEGAMYQMRNGEYRDEYKVFVNEGQGLSIKMNDSDSSAVIDGVTIPQESIIVSQSVYNQLFPLDPDGNEEKPYYDAEGNQIRHLFFHSINDKNTYVGSMFYQIGTINNDSTVENVDLLITEEDGVHYLEVIGKVNGEVNYNRQKQLIGLLKTRQHYYLNYPTEEGEVSVKCNPTSLFYNNYNNIFKLVRVRGGVYDRFLMKIWNSGTESWDDIDLVDLYRANLCRMIDGDYELTEVSRDTYSFKLKDENGNLMNIVRYGSQGIATAFSAEITERRNVSAFYITAPFIMGGLNYFKTVWQWTLTNDTGKPSELELAVASNKIPYIDSKTLASISKAKIGENYNDYTFEAVDYDKNVVPRTYTVQRTLGMQKFVCFAFKNDNNSNAILSSLSVIYTLPFPSYGND